MTKDQLKGYLKLFILGIDKLKQFKDALVKAFKETQKPTKGE